MIDTNAASAASPAGTGAGAPGPGLDDDIEDALNVAGREACGGFTFVRPWFEAASPRSFGDGGWLSPPGS